MNELTKTAEIENKIDAIRANMATMEAVECPVTHLFTKGLYVRRIFMPAFTINSKGEQVQTIALSKTHATQHPYVVTKGSAAVYNNVDDFLGIVGAGFIDITKPGTRRLLRILEDCVWTTFHPLSYITGEENLWSDEQKAELLLRIEKDIIIERTLSLEDVSDEKINYYLND